MSYILAGDIISTFLSCTLDLYYNDPDLITLLIFCYWHNTSFHWLNISQFDPFVLHTI